MLLKELTNKTNNHLVKFLCLSMNQCIFLFVYMFVCALVVCILLIIIYMKCIFMYLPIIETLHLSVLVFVFCISLIICNLIHFYSLWISAGVLCLCLLLWKTRFLSNPDPLFKFKTYPWDVLNILSIILIRIVLIDFWFAIFILINCT